MRRIRFTIGTLLVLVLFLGVSFAALREASPIWDGGILSLAIGTFLLSILLAVHRAEVKRAFWLGFAVFGSTYLGLTVVPSVESRLLTTQALVFLDSKVPGRPAVITGQAWGNPPNSPTVVLSAVPGPANAGSIAAMGQGTITVWNAPVVGVAGGWGGTTESFTRIGHSLVALIAAWLGGLLSRHLYARNRESAP